MNNRTTTEAWAKLERWLTTLSIIILVIVAIGAAINWKTKHDNYYNCLVLSDTIEYQKIGNNPYTDDLRQQYYNNQAQSQHTTDLNNCKQFLQ